MRTRDYFGERTGLRTLIVPGLQGSGPQHWQSLWQDEHLDYERVVQQDWGSANLENWAQAVVRQIGIFSGPVILVAHSFGCLASVRAAQLAPLRIRGAMLVAPANPLRFGIAHVLPRQPLHCPSLLVARRSDPWMSYGDAACWARRWGSLVVDAGNAGHINVPAGYGHWFEGEQLLDELREEVLHGSAGNVVSLAA